MPASDPRAHALVQRALLTGDLIRPAVCSECGKPPNGKGKIEAHHIDYAKPLEVEWLCPKCHRQRPTGTGGNGAMYIRIRLAPEVMRRIDEVRGDVPRDRWARRKVEEALDQGWG